MGTSKTITNLEIDFQCKKGGFVGRGFSKMLTKIQTTANRI
jgi:hypothetical protein